MTLGKGALTGFCSGLLSGPLMLAWCFAYSFLGPGDLGSMTGFVWFVSVIEATILGLLVGTLAGGVLRLGRVQLRTRTNWITFGVALMGGVGILMAVLSYLGSPEQFARWALFMIGLDVLATVLAGAAVGFVAGSLGSADQTLTGGSGSAAS